MPSPPTTIALTHYAGRAGDHNDLAMIGSRELVTELAARLGVSPTRVGTPEPALSVGWAEELEAARPTLEAMATQLDAAFRAGLRPVTASSRCAVALATLPVVAVRRPDAVIVWFDAHADLNTPKDTTTGFLGGLAYSGPLGLWDSGLGAGLAPSNAILVGARDIDVPEQKRLDAGLVTLVKVGPAIADELRDAVAGRPVYVHIDCDVLDAGTVPTDYLVPDGMTLHDLHAAAAVLAESEVVGIEIGELESIPGADTPPSYVSCLLDALHPLLRATYSSAKPASSDLPASKPQELRSASPCSAPRNETEVTRILRKSQHQLEEPGKSTLSWTGDPLTGKAPQRPR